MGCINTKPDIEIIKPSESKKNIILIIKKMIKDNPIYKFDLSDFKEIITYHIDPKETIISNNINCLLSHIPLTSIQESMLTEILTLAIDNLAYIYPSKSIFDSICYTIFFYLCKQTKELTDKKKTFIYYLLETTKEDLMIQTGKFSFMLFNIYKFLSYIMIYLFISPAILEIYEEFTSEKLEVIYIQKAACKCINPKSLYSYTMNKMKIINPMFSNEKCTQIAFDFIFSPVILSKFQVLIRIIILI